MASKATTEIINFICQCLLFTLHLASVINKSKVDLMQCQQIQIELNVIIKLLSIKKKLHKISSLTKWIKNFNILAKSQCTEIMRLTKIVGDNHWFIFFCTPDAQAEITNVTRMCSDVCQDTSRKPHHIENIYHPPIIKTLLPTNFQNKKPTLYIMEASLLFITFSTQFSSVVWNITKTFSDIYIYIEVKYDTQKISIINQITLAV